MAHENEPAHAHRHGSSHVPAGVGDRALGWSAAVNIALTVFQVIAGAIAGSVALMADALHNLNDALALVIAAVARRVARRRADTNYTFGYRRAELIGATINLTALIGIGGFLVFEAVEHLLSPSVVRGEWVMAGAGVALVVDVATVLLLWSSNRGGLNFQAVFVHNLTDALTSLAVLAGGAAVYFPGWNWIDPVLTLAIASYVLLSSVGMLRRSIRILMEGTPADLDLQALRDAVEHLPHVAGLHHLHVWELDEERRALEAHIVLSAGGGADQRGTKVRIKDLLRDRFGITHSTLEIEDAHDACRDRDADLIPDHS